MTRPRSAWVRPALAILGAALVAFLAFRFPWRAAIAAAAGADLRLLAIAFAVSLTSLVAKGWAWHLLMKPVVPSRWRTAQEANLVGSAVNSVSVSLTGEAARLAWACARIPGGAPLIGATIAWTRAAEGLGLALLLSVMPFVLRLPDVWGRVQIGAALLFWTGLALILSARRLGFESRLPRRVRPFARKVLEAGSPRRLVLPVLLALVNWAAQWITFHLVVNAVTPASATASFAALMAANLGGLFRLLPANVGIVQASMAAALAPFGIGPGEAVAAGVLLQLIQVPPVLAAGAALAGFRGLAAKENRWTIAPSTTST